MLINKKIYITILVAFLLSLITSSIFVKNFDRYEISTDEKENHAMIKGDIPDMWIDAQVIKNDLSNGKGYFESGKEIFRSYLPPRSFALYSYVFNYELFENWEKKIFSSDNKKIYFLFLQSIFYFFSLFVLFKEIKKHYEIKTCFFIICFLAFEPTIFLFHSTFHTESLFFTMQIFMLTMLINKSEKLIKFVGIGFLLGLMFLQKLVAIYYIIPISIYYILKLRGKVLTPLLTILVFYTFIIFLVGYGNYKRSNIFYFMPPSSKITLHLYFPSTIISKAEKIDEATVYKKVEEDRMKWINKNNINLDLEKDRIKYYDYLQNYTLEILLKYPLTTFKFISWRTLQTVILNPIYVYEFFSNESETRPPYYLEEKYKKINIPLRIIYSLIIYFIVLYGFFTSLKKIKVEQTVLLVLSSTYMLGLLGWANNSRYFVPILVYLSIFWGHGVTSLSKLKLFNKDIKK